MYYPLGPTGQDAKSPVPPLRRRSKEQAEPTETDRLEATYSMLALHEGKDRRNRAYPTMWPVTRLMEVVLYKRIFHYYGVPEPSASIFIDEETR